MNKMLAFITLVLSSALTLKATAESIRPGVYFLINGEVEKVENVSTPDAKGSYDNSYVTISNGKDRRLINMHNLRKMERLLIQPTSDYMVRQIPLDNETRDRGVSHGKVFSARALISDGTNKTVAYIVTDESWHETYIPTEKIKASERDHVVSLKYLAEAIRLGGKNETVDISNPAIWNMNADAQKSGEYDDFVNLLDAQEIRNPSEKFDEVLPGSEIVQLLRTTKDQGRPTLFKEAVTAAKSTAETIH